MGTFSVFLFLMDTLTAGFIRLVPEKAVFRKLKHKVHRKINVQTSGGRSGENGNVLNSGGLTPMDTRFRGHGDFSRGYLQRDSLWSWYMFCFSAVCLMQVYRFAFFLKALEL